VRMYAALSSRQGVLTGSLSWDLESPCLFDDFEVAGGRACASGVKVVAPSLHRRQSDGTMHKLNIILIFLVYKRSVSQR